MYIHFKGLLLCVILLTGCKDPEINIPIEMPPNIDYTDGAMYFINSINLTESFEKARWAFYCNYCERFATQEFRCTGMDSVLKDKTIGELELGLRTFRQYGDTIEYYFSFSYNGIALDYDNCQSEVSHNCILSTGIFMVILNNKVVGTCCEGCLMTHYWQEDKVPYLNNPELPSVFKYINANKTVLAKAFKDEAIKRGEIKNE